MNFKLTRQKIEDDLKKSLEHHLPLHNFSDVIKYSVFPTGKLFRPLLVHCLASDLGEITPSHEYLAMAIELHHTYTLIHDDLPAMDDDDFRRGRASSHKKFSEWQAILAGDALLNLSYEYLTNIENPIHLGNVLKLFTKACGPKGLVLGQIKDLGEENSTFEDLMHIHRLKTAELIMLCLSAGAILSDKSELISPLDRLGLALGENFQLLDDLGELTENINQHERDINPFLKFNSLTCLERLKSNQVLICNLCQDHKLENLKSYIDEFINKSKLKVSTNQHMIESYLKTKIDLSFL